MANPADPSTWIQSGALGLLGLVLFALYTIAKSIATAVKDALVSGLERFNKSADRFDTTITAITAASHELERNSHVRHLEVLAAMRREGRRDRHSVADVVQRFELRLHRLIMRELLREARCSACDEETLVTTDYTGEVLCEGCTNDRREIREDETEDLEVRRRRD